MKKIYILIFTLSLWSFVNAQSYNISFCGSGMSTIVDSVKVENLTQGTKITVSGSDILHLGSVGIPEQGNNDVTMQVYPNPTMGEASLSFFAEQNGNTDLSIYNVSGKRLLQFNKNLSRGRHKYKISCLKQGMYFISIKGEKYTYTCKLISQNPDFCVPEIEYLGSENSIKNKAKTKSTNAIVNMAFTAGDQIRVTGYAYTYHHTTTFIPVSNIILTFNFSTSLASLTTKTATLIDTTTATSGGNINNDGGDFITERGICYNTLTNPSVSNTKIICGIDTGSFIANLVNLIPNTTYYVRAYAINTSGIAYGNQINLTTLPVCHLASLTTSAITAITTTTAVTGGNVSSDGGAAVSSRGVCYRTASNPSLADSVKLSGSGTGAFTANLSNLIPNTNYYVRAFATNSIGIAYGNQLNFTTLALTLASLTTSAISAITITTAVSGGNVTSDGGAVITARGVCWDTATNPVIINNKTINSGTTGIFSATLTNLIPSANYYVRAYASNAIGTAYGNQLNFTTLPLTIASLTTTAISAITTTTAISGGNVTSDGGTVITARGVCWDTISNPSILSKKTTDTGTIGNFTSTLTNLIPSSNYYVRAYASNAIGTAYGNQISFVTNTPLTVANVTTLAVTAITSNSAIFGGDVTSDGGSVIITRGFCWDTVSNPTLADSTAVSFGSLGQFYNSINGLTASTTYYVKSFATNSVGTAYGNEINFTTNPPPTIATLSTNNATLITATSAISGGNITSNGGAAIINCGVCWDTAANPNVNNNKTINTVNTGLFNSGIYGLTPATLYYLRAYAVNSVGTAYGNQITFYTLANYNNATVIDIDGNIYDTLHIGTQVWLKQNLKVTRYNNGDVIPNIITESIWQNLTTGAYGDYNNIPANGISYGRLYNFYTAVDPRNLCPYGWHVPSGNEWVTLSTYLGGDNYSGGKLKETGTIHWNYPNGGASNSTGFTALPAGFRLTYGPYGDLGTFADFMTTTVYTGQQVWYREISCNYSNLYNNVGYKTNGYSVRCLKN